MFTAVFSNTHRAGLAGSGCEGTGTVAFEKAEHGWTPTKPET